MYHSELSQCSLLPTIWTNAGTGRHTTNTQRAILSGGGCVARDQTMIGFVGASVFYINFVAGKFSAWTVPLSVTLPKLSRPCFYRVVYQSRGLDPGNSSKRVQHKQSPLKTSEQRLCKFSQS